MPPFVTNVTVPGGVCGQFPGGGSGQIAPAFATSVTLPPQHLIVPVMQKNDQQKPPIFSGQNFKRWR
ncbi:hypothetical protein, partial [Mycobacterium tuberculosis]